MQNLPLLVTQNTSVKTTSTASYSQKTSESGKSFQQVLSKQVKSEAPNEKAAQVGKGQKSHAQENQVHENQVQENSVQQAIVPPIEQVASGNVKPTVEQLVSGNVKPTIEQLVPGNVKPTVEQLVSGNVKPTIEQLVSGNVKPTVEQLVSGNVKPTVEQLVSGNVKPTVEQLVSGNMVNVNNKDVGLLTGAGNLPHEIEQKSIKRTDSKELKDASAEDVLAQAAQDVNVANASLQLPVVNPNPSLNMMPAINNEKQGKGQFTGIDSQKRQQATIDLSKVINHDNFANPLDKNTLDDIKQRVESDAENSNWLDSILPKSNKSMEGAKDINSKIMTNLVPEVSAKLGQEAPVQQAPTALTTAAYQAATQLSTTQVQSGMVNTISAYPGKAGWDQAISQKVMWMVGASEQSATLTLNPPDLGPLQVVISVNNDKVDTTFISENSEVRKALESGMSNLRDSMGQAGIQLGQANVNTSQQQDFQQAAKERLPQQGGGSPSLQLPETPTSVQTMARSNIGLVDTFA